MKCSNAEVYSQTKEKLIDEQEVFAFLNRWKFHLLYNEMRHKLTLQFWISENRINLSRLETMK